MSNDKKPDFSNVQGGFSTDAKEVTKPDFSNVQGGFSTDAEVVGERTYTIEKGDTLSAVSQRFYGKAKFWRQIFEANRDTIDNPDRIFPGQTIKLPAIDINGDGTPDDPAAA